VDVKTIHIGKLVKELWQEKEISMERTCKFFRCKKEDIDLMFRQKTMETDTLLRWSKLVEYDFFRIYSQHLILFAPKTSGKKENKPIQKNADDKKIPLFRKNIYTKEIINHLLELIDTNQKTPLQIITEYKIPRTTIYRWIQKYTIKENDG